MKYQKPALPYLQACYIGESLSQTIDLNSLVYLTAPLDIATMSDFEHPNRGTF